LVLTLVTPFLRRAAGFIHTAYGLDLAQDTPWLEAARQEAKASARRSILDPDKELEVKRLLYILRLPSLEALLLAPVREPAKHAHTVGLIEGWLDQLRRFRGRHKSFVSVGSGYTMTIPIGMPTYFTLLDFPQQFEVLFELSSKAICPNCQSIPEDSALCLMCGRFLCCQSFCCERDGIGECNVHMKTCGGTMGLFLLVKKCGLAFLYHDNGCFRATPFLDQHGEFDMGLRRGRPLFLNAERYNKLRQTLLDHQLPSTIARDIDPEFNIGGWITL
ncbi:E3 ubiquitin-protein ligase ubr1, partial [Spiromyces aspiralis]